MKKCLLRIIVLFMSFSILACKGKDAKLTSKDNPVETKVTGVVTGNRIVCRLDGKEKNLVIFQHSKSGPLRLEGELLRCITEIEVEGKKYYLTLGEKDFEVFKRFCASLKEGDALAIAKWTYVSGEIEYRCTTNNYQLKEAIDAE